MEFIIMLEKSAALNVKGHIDLGEEKEMVKLYGNVIVPLVIMNNRKREGGKIRGDQNLHSSRK